MCYYDSGIHLVPRANQQTNNEGKRGTERENRRETGCKLHHGSRASVCILYNYETTEDVKDLKVISVEEGMDETE